MSGSSSLVWVFHGSMLAHGLWFDRNRLDELEIRRTILQSPSGIVLSLAGGYLLRWSNPRRVLTKDALGVPVIRRGEAWIATPKLPDNASLQEPHLWLLRGGTIESWPLNGAEVIDLAQWIDISRWTVEASIPWPKVVDHSYDPKRTRVISDPEGPASPFAEWLGPPPEGHTELLAALKDAAESGPAQAPSRRRWAEWWQQWWPASDATEPAALPSAPSVDPPLPPQRGWMHAMRDWWAQQLARSRLGALLGQQQARYIERTLQMFEAGDLHNALRHAIPFSSGPNGPRPPRLGAPTPRAELELRAAAAPESSSSYHLRDELFERFKALYRQAAADLERQGHIEEAAYALIELLGEVEEGIALLERHGLYALAAQIAEGRHLAISRVIRLLFLAGDPTRAVILARRTGTFADVVHHLERDSSPMADTVRLLWADHLASSGDYVGAVQALDPIVHRTHSEHLARTWIDRGIAYGPPIWQTMLTRKLWFYADPATLDEVQRELDPLWSSDSALDQERRRALAAAMALRRESMPTHARFIACRLGRHVVADNLDPATGVRLLQSAGDQALVFEMHATDGIITLQPRPQPHFPMVVDAHDVGLHNIRHGLFLPNGQCILALGDTGCETLDGEGLRIRTDSTPVDRWIPAHTGTRAIGLQQRGSLVSLRQIDFTTGEVNPWYDTRIDAWAPSYDGSLWYIAAEDSVYALDAQAPELTVAWRVGDLGGHVLALEHRTWPKGPELTFAVQTAAAIELYHYQLTDNGPALRFRTEIDPPSADALAPRVVLPPQHQRNNQQYADAVSFHLASIIASPQTNTYTLHVQTARSEVHAGPLDGRVLDARWDCHDLWVLIANPRGIQLHRFDDTLSIVQTITLAGATHATIAPRGTMKDPIIALTDDRGRVLGLNTLMRVVRSLRF